MIDPIHLDTSGPLFQPDRTKTVEENTRRLIQGLVEQGESMVKAGWTNSVHGREGVTGRAYSLAGKPWKFVGTITPSYVYPWPSGSPKQYRGGKNKVRRRAFGAALARIRAARYELIADLTAGLS